MLHNFLCWLFKVDILFGTSKKVKDQQFGMEGVKCLENMNDVFVDT